MWKSAVRESGPEGFLFLTFAIEDVQILLFKYIYVYIHILSFPHNLALEQWYIIRMPWLLLCCLVCTLICRKTVKVWKSD